MSAYQLNESSKVALVCTGTPCESKNDPRSTVEYLAKHYHLCAEYGQDTYFSLPAARRAEIFYDYLQDDSYDVIWSVRGGEGTADLVPFLEARAHQIRKARPKLLLGFSDFTALLVYFQQRFAWPVAHSAGARQFHRRMVNQTSEQQTFQWLTEGASICLQDLQALNSAAHCERVISALVTGGNLTLLHLSLQDVWQLDSCGKILLLEEVNEKPYQVIRTLKHLLRVGFFNGVKAVIFAGFDFPSLSDDQNKRLFILMQKVFVEFASQVAFPVLFTEKVGHSQNNFPIPFYQKASLKLGNELSLTFASQGV